MHPFVLIPFFAGVAASVIASAVLARNTAQRADRLVATILGCAAYWCFLEVIWNTQDDPRVVTWLVRASSLGWMPLGALCFHLFVELIGRPSARMRRLVPALYALAGVCSALYIATPWGVAGVVRTNWGWGLEFGPIFPFVLTLTTVSVVVTLAVLWRRVYPRGAPPSERRQGYFAFAAISIPTVVAFLSDALLPLNGIQMPRLGSASLTLIGASVAWSVLRYGYSIVAPGSLANEILATLREGVALLRYDGVIRVANGGLGRLVGCRPKELTGRSLTDLIPALRTLGVEEIQERECEITTAAGRPVPVAVSSSPVRDRQGNRVGWVAVVRDLREVAALRRNLAISGRMAAVGELAAGIAHEINNPIAFIQSNLLQLREHWHTVEKLHAGPAQDARLTDILSEAEELVDESLDGVERVAAIVRDVRGFSHAGHREREIADLNELLDSTLRLASPQFRQHATLKREFGEIPLVSCNPQQLKQVFLNLIVNAAHAVGDSGAIRVATYVERDHAVIEIEDDGCGIPEAVIDRVFDPFFTTKTVGEGTGLGLAISYQIVRNHGGELQVESEPGRGSCFRVTLPIDTNGAETADP
ncbi:MAG: PAS domain S-box protein [Deltaproteobacteria bacterium]|nr:MAG: PAS domain S-box protein [Deltaproteobacteria bacterium]